MTPYDGTRGVCTPAVAAIGRGHSPASPSRPSGLTLIPRERTTATSQGGQATPTVRPSAPTRKKQVSIIGRDDVLGRPPRLLRAPQAEWARPIEAQLDCKDGYFSALLAARALLDFEGASQALGRLTPIESLPGDTGSPGGDSAYLAGIVDIADHFGDEVHRRASWIVHIPVAQTGLEPVDPVNAPVQPVVRLRVLHD